MKINPVPTISPELQEKLRKAHEQMVRDFAEMGRRISEFLKSAQGK